MLLMEVNLSLEDKIKLSPEVIVQIIRILQEALSNIRKHSGADQVWINTREDGHDMILEIRDNGNGFTAEDIPEISRHGLKGMRERAELI
jgi:signal transduction histidine kinase